MRKKFEEALQCKTDIKLIKCTQTIKPNPKNVLFWFVWYGCIIAMKLDEQNLVENDKNELTGIIRCCNRHNKNEKGERCVAAAKVKY